MLASIAEADSTFPVAVMTYVNPVLADRSGRDFVGARGRRRPGVIVPDLPVDEGDELRSAAAAHDIDVVLLAAPGTDPERYAAIGAAAHGFVYCVSTYGVTGAREELAATAREVVDAMRPHTDAAPLVGVGIAPRSTLWRRADSPTAWSSGPR